MTFEEWKATRRDATITELADSQGIDVHDYCDTSVVGGYLYDDGGFIERLSSGDYHLLISNDTVVSSDLSMLEHKLWEEHSVHNYDDWEAEAEDPLFDFSDVL